MSEGSKKHDYYPKNFNRTLLPKQNFEEYRNNDKKDYEENQGYLAEHTHQEPDHPSTFMKMIMGRANAIATANDERRQVLNPCVIWDGSIDLFEIFRNNVEGHYGQIGAGYLFDSDFQEEYLEKGVDCYIDFLNEVPSVSQIKKNAHALYGSILNACQSGVGRRILMENRSKQDGIRSWCQLVMQYEKDGNRNVRIRKLENVITTISHRKYRGGLVKRIQDYEEAFTELVPVGQKTWSDDEIKKLCFIQNTQNVGLVDAVFEELVSDKSFIETCNFLIVRYCDSFYILVLPVESELVK